MAFVTTAQNHGLLLECLAVTALRLVAHRCRGLSSIGNRRGGGPQDLLRLLARNLFSLERLQGPPNAIIRFLF